MDFCHFFRGPYGFFFFRGAAWESIGPHGFISRGAARIFPYFFGGRKGPVFFVFLAFLFRFVLFSCLVCSVFCLGHVSARVGSIHLLLLLFLLLLPLVILAALFRVPCLQVKLLTYPLAGVETKPFLTLRLPTESQYPLKPPSPSLPEAPGARARFDPPTRKNG